jgi:hypothetical protein
MVAGDSHRPSGSGAPRSTCIRRFARKATPGSYNRVCAFVRRWKEKTAANPKRAAYVPLTFALGEAFQFDWSCEYVFVGGLRRRLEVAHTKLCASRAFWLVAYPARATRCSSMPMPGPLPPSAACRAGASTTT